MAIQPAVRNLGVEELVILRGVVANEIVDSVQRDADRATLRELAAVVTAIDSRIARRVDGPVGAAENRRRVAAAKRPSGNQPG